MLADLDVKSTRGVTQIDAPSFFFFQFKKQKSVKVVSFTHYALTQENSLPSLVKYINMLLFSTQIYTNVNCLKAKIKTLLFLMIFKD